MKCDFWKAVRVMLAQLLELDINEQLLRENEYLREELQVLKAKFKQSNKKMILTDE